MGRSVSSWKWLRRPSPPSRRAPNRGRSWILESLEDRRLPSHAVQPLVTLPGPSLDSTNMIAGLDGDLWVGVHPTVNSSAIDRIGLDGSVSTFAVPGDVTVNALATGPDGNVWFIGDLNAASATSRVVLGNVTPAGQIAEFPPIPVAAGQDGASFGAELVDGPDHDLWFSDAVLSATPQDPIVGQSFIGRATTAGAVTLFPVSASNSNTGGLFSLASGADGNLWFTEQIHGKGGVLDRMSPSGVVTDIPIGRLSRGVVEVANGPNGSLIVTTQNARAQAEKVFRMTTAGTLTPYKIPAAISTAFSYYLGPADRSLWFTNQVGTRGRSAGSPPAARPRRTTCPDSSPAEAAGSSRWPSERTASSTCSCRV